MKNAKFYHIKRSLSNVDINFFCSFLTYKLKHLSLAIERFSLLNAILENVSIEKWTEIYT